MLLVMTNESRAAAAARIGGLAAVRERSALMGAVRSCFARAQTWLQAGKYVRDARGCGRFPIWGQPPRDHVACDDK